MTENLRRVETTGPLQPLTACSTTAMQKFRSSATSSLLQWQCRQCRNLRAENPYSNVPLSYVVYLRARKTARGRDQPRCGWGAFGNTMERCGR